MAVISGEPWLQGQSGKNDNEMMAMTLDYGLDLEIEVRWYEI